MVFCTTTSVNLLKIDFRPIKILYKFKMLYIPFSKLIFYVTLPKIFSLYIALSE